MVIAVRRWHGVWLVAMVAGCFADAGVAAIPDGGTDGGSGGSDESTLPDADVGSGSGTGPGADDCGDAVLDADEECDLGPDNSDSGQCTSQCRISRCGDGLIHLGIEACDDGNADDGDACTSVCLEPVCGDGLVSANEGCDDGADGNGPGMACSARCTPNVCGDGDVGPDEECDDGDTNGRGQTCNARCLHNVCGDGDRGPAESCDDGNLDPGDGCDAACKSEACGDSIVDRLEACDDGANGDQDDGCTDDCNEPACGDGYVQTSLAEACDDGDENGDDAACTSTCEVASCGDGHVYATVEECDDGNDVDDDACTNACTDPACGDGILQMGAGEACDDGNADEFDACPSDCQLAECNDGVLEGTEDCEPALPLSSTCVDLGFEAGSLACDPSTCNFDDSGCTGCGDGVTDAGEDCDDGNQVTEPCDYGETECTVCDDACQSVAGTVSYCGDAFVDAANGETCDDGNAATEVCDYGETECTVCDATCQLVPGVVSFCGDGAADAAGGEECDPVGFMPILCSTVDAAFDMGAVACTPGCTHDLSECSLCGDSVTEGLEECDDGDDGDDSNGCMSECVAGLPPILDFSFDFTWANGGSAGAAYDGVPNQLSFNGADPKFGTGAMSLNGGASLFVVPNTVAVLSTSPDYTVSVWFREDVEQAADLFNFRLNGTPGGGLWVRDTAMADSTVWVGASAAPSGNGFFTTAATAATQWHNVTYRCDGSSLVAPGGCDLQVYLDGAYQGQVLMSGNVIFSPDQNVDLLVGQFSTYDMDDFRIYDTVFSPRGQCIETWRGTWNYLDDSCVMP
ncbi:MAG: DUF4215 domain-containing protein [Myxococcota bacterium]